MGQTPLKVSPASEMLRKFFAGYTEHVFQVQFGVVDTQLIDYLVQMLLKFVHMDTLMKVRTISGKPAQDLTGMLYEASRRVGEARRSVYAHIGDYTLFWSGVYPEALKKLRVKDGQTSLVGRYWAQGKRAYLAAGGIEGSRDAVSSELLTKLAHEYMVLAYGLREARKEWEKDTLTV